MPADFKLQTSDFFSFMGFPRKLRLDAAELEKRFRALSREYHPDYFYNAPPAERRASLERSSYLNDAYRTLKQPASRIAYLLQLEGFGTAQELSGAGGHNPKVPASLLEEVFALNEELAEIREARESGAPPSEWQARLESARQPIETRRREHESELEALSVEWDAAVDAGSNGDRRREILSALRDRYLERNYIANLLAGIEREATA